MQHKRTFLLALLPTALAAACQQPPPAEELPQRTVHQPSATRPYSAAVQVGDTYWLSGKIGVTQATASMEDGRTAAETRNIMGSFETLLAELDMDFGNVVRGVVYLTDIGDYAEMNEAYGSYFESGQAPSRVTLAVSELVGGAAIEISFVAVRDGGDHDAGRDEGDHENGDGNGRL